MEATRTWAGRTSGKAGRSGDVGVDLGREIIGRPIVRPNFQRTALASSRDHGVKCSTGAAAGFGAGFGGSVWALVPAVDADAFAALWLERYLAEFPAVADTASTLVTRPGGPARRLD